MRIAVVNNFYPPRVGGSAHMAHALAHKYAEAGHEVLVLTAQYRDAPTEEVSPDGVRVVRVPSWTLPSFGLEVDFDITFTSKPGNLRLVSGLLDDFQPQVIHQHGQFLDLSWLSGHWAKKHNVPVLLSIHTRLESADWKYKFAFRNLDRFMVRPLTKRYKPRYVIMDKLAATYSSQRYGATENDFVNIPVPIDPARFLGATPSSSVEHLGGVQGPLIVSIGHVIPLRSRLPLINAMPRVLEEFPTAKVLVVGHVYFDAFVHRARELGVEHSVLSIGAVPKDEVPGLLAAADVVAHDLHGIGCGTASLEAMAAGRPTIATVDEDNFPGVDLTNWQNSILVAPDDHEALADAIIRVLKDPDSAARIAAAQRETVLAHFTLDAVTEQHLRTFEAMIDESTTRGAGHVSL